MSRYLYLTTYADALLIAESRVLLPAQCGGVGSTYAASVDGCHVPSVQHPTTRDAQREAIVPECAVLFDVAAPPDTVRPEEVIWLSEQMREYHALRRARPFDEAAFRACEARIAAEGYAPGPIVPLIDPVIVSVETAVSLFTDTIPERW